MAALGGGGGIGKLGGQSFCLWNKNDSEESSLNLECVFISTVGSLFT